MLVIALCWSTVAFTVATVVLAVQIARIQADLNDVLEKLDYLESALEGEIRPRYIESEPINNVVS